jgi:heme-degrading monooxygenase HmoA
MSTISPEQKVVTLINTFTVIPGKQEELIRLLDETNEQFMSKQEGFISANIHKGINGDKVANYAQWRSREDFDRVMQNPEFHEHSHRTQHLVEKFEPTLYELEASIEPGSVKH